MTAAKIRPVRVTLDVVDAAHNFFLQLASRDFETSLRMVKKL